MPDSTGWSAPFQAVAPAGEELVPDSGGTPSAPPAFATYYLTTDQSIPYNTATLIGWNGKTGDTDFPSASSQITLPYSGVYIITVQAHWEQRTGETLTVHIEARDNSSQSITLRSDGHLFAPFKTSLGGGHSHGLSMDSSGGHLHSLSIDATGTHTHGISTSDHSHDVSGTSGAASGHSHGPGSYVTDTRSHAHGGETGFGGSHTHSGTALSEFGHTHSGSVTGTGTHQHVPDFNVAEGFYTVTNIATHMMRAGSGGLVQAAVVHATSTGGALPLRSGISATLLNIAYLGG